jgi:hypothetical protein
MSMLAQAYAGTGDAIFKQKLDYIVKGSPSARTRSRGGAEATLAPRASSATRCD